MIDTKIHPKLNDPELASTPASLSFAPMQQQTESLQSSSSHSEMPAHALDSATPPTEEVAALAYQLWIGRGSPHGSHEEDWQRAEQELRNRQQLARTAGA
jgi:hypothetical protein